MPNNIPRLDVLLYAHDGRGLGHVSRSIAIGIALRRLYPEFRVLFLSGSSICQEFIGSAPLDWIKLPAYETKIENGKSSGLPGKSNFEDKELGKLRGEQIKQIIAIYQPRIVLVDHSPQGKHKELMPALEDPHTIDVQWVLGIRGIVGNVKQISSSLAASVFQKFYTSLLWYGDSQVLGKAQLKEIQSQYGIKPHECGYVSAIKERTFVQRNPEKNSPLGTVSIPWFGEKTADFLNSLHSVLKALGPNRYKWNIFLDQTHSRSAEFTNLFQELPGCRVEAPGRRYLDSLVRSRHAVIYGGYNSLMDVLSLSLPALVILRDMKDKEQQEHLNRLVKYTPDGLAAINEECGKDELHAALQTLTSKPQLIPFNINLRGAEQAAHHLAALL